MTELYLKFIEKLGSVLPVSLSSALLITFALGTYLWDVRMNFDKSVVVPLSSSAVLLFVKYGRDRKLQPKLTIWKADVLKIRDLTSRRQSDSDLIAKKTLASTALQNIRIHLSAEISSRAREGFFSRLKRKRHHIQTANPCEIPGAYEYEEASTAIYVSEVEANSLDPRWWKGIVYRVGNYWNSNDQSFEWFTADIDKFYEKYKRQLRKLR